MRSKNNFLITTSWDDGSKLDIKLSRLLVKYHIPATFYIPLNCELNNKEIVDISKNFEIGGHTVNHPELTKISVENAKKEIGDCKFKLESIINKKITSFCYPKGKFNQEIKQIVGLAGFEYARTTKILVRGVGDRLLAGTSIHASNHFYLPNWEYAFYKYFEFVKNFGGIFHLWGHAWEIEKNKDWDKLERVLKYVSKNTKSDHRVTNGEIVSYFRSKKSDYYAQKYI